ncbi:MAG: DNA translocase FtsK, partial [Saprospiraceae bacterium]|nr:DNA translocase FtsK [Saprospiraceae bacterium]
ALLFVFLGIAFIIWNFHHITEKSTFSFRWPSISFPFSSALRDPDLTDDPDDISLDLDEDKTAKSETKKSAFIDELDRINKSALEFDLPKAQSKPVVTGTSDATLEVVEMPPKVPVVETMEEKESFKTPLEREKPELIVEQENEVHLEPYDPTMALPKYERPRLSLLLNYEEDNVQIDRAELEQNKDQIINTLRHYKIEIERIRATIGPTVTLYEIVPAPGVRISKIKNLEDDIALSLAALGIRIIAPIPGKGTIGIEVPNKNKQTVGLKELLHADKFKHGKMDLPIALGKTISNEVFIADLAKMPHLLIAGATGQGKSVGINTILMSLLYKKHPSQVKLVLIDPKKVELFPYGQLANHFLAFLPDQDEPIITETKKVVNTLNSLCIEMDQRYDLLKKAHARNIQEYNKKFIARRLNPNNGHRFLPFIVLVIDEFADLIMTAGKEVELPIARLAQLARAVGIHLIIATQRPSVNIITGVIKANFPARLAFRVTSKVDSRTILDAGGADQLIGRGDMLLTVGGDMIRLQCAFVDTPEVENVINGISKQQGFSVPFFLPEYSAEDEGGKNGAFSLSDLDEMFEDAAMLVINSQQGSTSMIQRRLKLGYNRAGRIMDQLEAVGVVGPNEGSKAREVLMTTEMEFHQQLELLRQ